MPNLATLGIALALLAGETPFQDLKLDQALATARAENKVVLIDFFTTWCPPCKQMDAQTWPQARIKEWVSKNAIAIRINAEAEREIAQRYSVKAYPSMLFVKPDGTERDRLVGFVETGRFVAEADEIVRGDGIVERARTSLVGHEDEPSLRENHGRALVARARLDEGFAEFVWCFDKGAGNASYATARRTSLIGEFVRLADSYAPAAKFLDDHRAETENALLDGHASVDIARDFAALNRARNMDGRTAEVYLTIAKAGHLSEEVKEALLADVVGCWMLRRDYPLVVEAIGDADARVAKLVDAVEALRKQGPDARTREAAALSTAMDKGGTYYEALVATGHGEPAGHIVDRLVKLQPANTTYVALIGHALRAEANDAARALADRAYATLTEREQKLVKIAARKIPEKQ